FFSPAIKEAHFGQLLWRVLHFGYDTRHGNDANGQNIATEKVIEKATLPRFETAHNGNVQRCLFSEAAAALEKIFERREPVTLTQVPDGIECALDELRSQK